MSDSDKKFEERLDFGQELRHDLVVNLITDESGAKTLPTDKDTLDSIRNLLKDVSDIELKRRKLDIAETAVEVDLLAAQVLANLSKDRTARSRGGDNLPGENKILGDKSKLPNFNIDRRLFEPVGNEVDINKIQEEGRKHFKGESNPTEEGDV